MNINERIVIRELENIDDVGALARIARAAEARSALVTAEKEWRLASGLRDRGEALRVTIEEHDQRRAIIVRDGHESIAPLPPTER